jgi:phospho-N-acetylmuramoyl-pentapeptide-transferase
MGGLIFILSTIVVMLFLLLTGKVSFNSDLKIVFFVFVSYAFIGFLDDFLSIKRGKNEGLSVIGKFFLQLVVALVFFYLYMKNGGKTSLIVTTLGIHIEMKWLYGIFILFILVGSSNAVNLTDGLDGLAAGLSAIAFIAFSLISLMVGYTDMGIFTLVLTGALLGFLIYNGFPAKVFMGDTGSLALGAVMGTIAIITHREITLFIVAFIFVLETLSVIFQVFWFKTFKKRLFLMTPIHHHFQKLGWSEVEIVRTFWVFGFILAMAGIIFGVWI